MKITWTNDCHGKQSFDAVVVALDSRYWPAHKAGPHAVTGIYFGDADTPVASAEFHGAEDAVKADVEQWASLAIQKIEAAVRAALASMPERP